MPKALPREPQGLLGDVVEQAPSSTVHATLPEDMLLRTRGLGIEKTPRRAQPSGKTSGCPTRRGRRARLHPWTVQVVGGRNFCTKGTSCRKARDSSSAAQCFLEGSLFQSTLDLGLLEES